MILTYHNIGDTQDKCWVSVKAFKKQMSDLKANGYKVVTIEEYDEYNDSHILITFDDGRKNIFQVFSILKNYNFPFYVFVIGDFLKLGSSAKNNLLDSEFISESDFDYIKENGGFLGWHSKSHKDLTKLSYRDLKLELENPYNLKFFAYPYFKWNNKVVKVLKELGYQYARSGEGYINKDYDNFCLDSVFVQEYTNIKYVKDKIRKYMDMAYFAYPCNLRCHYCYVGQFESNEKRSRVEPSKYSPQDLERALNKKRMGGKCIVTFSAAGETLATPKSIEYLKAILNAGHFLHISTNLTLSKRIDELLQLPEEQFSRLFFKASVQYLELKRLDLLDVFAENCKKIWAKGGTCALEIVPNDELVPYIDEIKEWSLKNFGALPQLSIPRDEKVPEVKLLSKYDIKEFARIWEDFYSEEFRFKVEMWEKPIDSFCYAGYVSCFVMINSGAMLTCPKSENIGNFFEGDKLERRPAGKCKQEHCFVCHNWLGFGSCPGKSQTNYLLERDRIMPNGQHWISERCRNAFRQHVFENNLLFSKKKEKLLILKDNIKFFFKKKHKL